MKNNFNCGIYKIENILNGECYIGQSTDLYSRISHHLRKLETNKNKHPFLQDAYNKYGKKNFISKVILYCEKFELSYYEQKLIDLWNPAYNICKQCVNSRLGVKAPNKTKNLISKNHADCSGNKNGRFLKKEKVLEILNLLNKEFSKNEIIKTSRTTGETIKKVKDGWYNQFYDLT
jgi:group I intron endonuclease